MISEEIMRKADGKNINIFFVDGEVYRNVKCTNFYRKEEDYEENMIEIGNVLINQSEIQRIEII